LLSAHNIQQRLLSYQEHNMRTQGPRLIRSLLAGKSVALVSDAGTPGISDPGADLVRRAVAQGVRVSSIPGPSAVTAVLPVSGLPVHPFLFLGFAPNRPGNRRAFFTKYARVEETLVLFESPRRLGGCLKDMRKIWGNRRVAVARELTKMYEEVFRGSMEEAIARWPAAARGEITLVVAGAEHEKQQPDDSLTEHLRTCLASDRRPLKEITAEIAEERSISRRLVYQEAIKIKRELDGKQ
jgi:16S rRNA (cytidine1402-2'-O)-methyltransferase